MSRIAVNVEEALARIRYSGSREPNLDTLRSLQHAFLESVPFENLDIHTGRKISLDPSRVYEKIVGRRRGGFCYECNGLFAELLAALGYKVSRLSARMALDGKVGPEFDHMVLLVSLDREYFADVGNGRSVRDPLALDGDGTSEAERVEYRVGAHAEGYALYYREAGSDWLPRFLFTTVPREQSEFSKMCEYHQTSPQSTFTQKRLATIATPQGRITLLDDRLVETSGAERKEQELTSEDEVLLCLRTRFGIELVDTDSGRWNPGSRRAQ
jgi:N-hydroxyarylamine O-acetyltransferase